MLMFLFQALYSLWVLFIVSIQVQLFLILRRKMEKLAQPLILSVLEVPELFWACYCCFLSGPIVCLVWGFVFCFVLFFSYLISVLVCAMWYQETAFWLLSYEGAAEKKTSFIM